MARTWTVADAWKALHMDGDHEARTDIAKRFPLFATAGTSELISSLSMVSARKVESTLRGELPEGEEAEDAEEVSPPKARVEKTALQTGSAKPSPKAEKLSKATSSKPEPAKSSVATKGKGKSPRDDDDLSSFFDEEEDE